MGLGACVIGIDPGVHGAIAEVNLCTGELESLNDIPLNLGGVDATKLTSLLQSTHPLHVFIERGGAPRESNRFKIGQAYGVALGVIDALGIEYTLVAPNSWKSKFDLFHAGKAGSREAAMRIWPDWAARFSQTKDHHRAEAALIARYGAQFVLKKGRA